MHYDYYLAATLLAASLMEPSRRYGHKSAVVDGELYMWGGAGTKDDHKVSVFSPLLECWDTKSTTGPSPTRLYGGASTSAGHHLYHYGGRDGRQHLQVSNCIIILWTNMSVTIHLIGLLDITIYWTDLSTNV